MSTQQAREAKIFLRPVDLGMLQLFVDAALLEGTCDFSLRNLVLTDLPAIAVSKYTYTQGYLNRNSIEIMEFISYRGKRAREFFQYLQTWLCLIILLVCFIYLKCLERWALFVCF